jgi:hypothetical protein
MPNNSEKVMPINSESDRQPAAFRAVTPFSDDMRPLLLNLRAHFAKIPLPTLFRIQGSYAVRFYLFCKS